MCFLANRVGKMLAMNLYSYAIIGYRATNIHEEYIKAKISLTSVSHLLISLIYLIQAALYMILMANRSVSSYLKTEVFHRL